MGLGLRLRVRGLGFIAGNLGVRTSGGFGGALFSWGPYFTGSRGLGVWVGRGFSLL